MLVFGAIVFGIFLSQKRLEGETRIFHSFAVRLEDIHLSRPVPPADQLAA